MKNRNDLGFFLQKYNKLGVGAEVGVKRGFFSHHLLNNGWNGKIIGVDKWESSGDREDTTNRLANENVQLITGFSVEVAETIPDESLDWVYIDADHRYESIKADYTAWYPKVRPGGIICGHDYGINDFGVKQFIDELGVPFELTEEDKPYQSWIIIK